MPRGRLFVISGNICAGKSYVIRALGCEAFIEPSAQDNEYLDDFYSDPKRFAEVMQFYILHKRYKVLIQALYLVLQGEDVFLDRAIWDDFVFVWKNYEDGNFSSQALEEYVRLRDFLIEELHFPSAFIYLDVSVEECLRRNREMRQNKCESGLTADYLQGLQEGYEFIRREARAKNVPWFTIDWNNFGTADDIRNVVKDIEPYPDTVNWVKKINDSAWISSMEERILDVYETARQKVYPEMKEGKVDIQVPVEC